MLKSSLISTGHGFFLKKRFTITECFSMISLRFQYRHCRNSSGDLCSSCSWNTWDSVQDNDTYEGKRIISSIYHYGISLELRLE
jgi:hypothetical protein